MTDQEKAKAYDEALEMARNLYPGVHSHNKAMLEQIFPELRESEEERIRNCLRCLTSLDQAQDVIADMGFTRQDLLAYLEKQKECSMSAEEVLTRAGLKPYKDGNQWCILAGLNIQEGICGFGDTIDEALFQFLMKVLEKQKEQKSANNYLEWRNIVYYVLKEWLGIGQYMDMAPFNDIVKTLQEKYSLPQSKPVEWSEEDKTRLTNILIMLQEYVIHHYSKDDVNKSVDWLKDLPERFNLQPKQEWSEEDKQNLDNIIWLCENCEKGIENVWIPSQAKEIKRLIKSLRPSWKPSEHQMTILKAVKEYVGRGSGYWGEGLGSLIKDLEKLM